MMACFWAYGNLMCFDVRGNEIRISGHVFCFVLFYVLFSRSLSCVRSSPRLLDDVCSSSVSCRGSLSAEENIHGT